MKTLRVICGVALVVGAFILSGCASTITATPCKESGNDGLPYYLPKPYLLIMKNLTPLAEKITETKDGGGKTTAIEREVKPVSLNKTEGDSFSFQIIYLPDLNEKKCLKILSRTGEVKTNITLIDGWKFVGLNLEADAKTSEIIKAISEIIPKIPFEEAKRKKADEDLPKEQKAELWLYEIKVHNGTLRYEEVLHWQSK